ncbi:hypothetical protein EG346_18575 [Chryseobacterium carnipullorum]|uniref:Uncharacterized protein n=1 Tax=Chryseobacterium carnipullorum TaxID=1124835 RepID=A0A376DWM8_CHRCU|nr:hypothetical protein [Chryseobacterium carnipullorum]AZA50061.1 hypothetical protein EG346_18575 [Chryseobacterium carnipullorum]AZA64939.1 hypothetical protein EG345_09610 [Chryseobacterium carnipullorum]STC96947.1 Uncharacterised protein [Chryseobacterium carnipullorum]
MKLPKRLFLETRVLSYSTLGIIILVILSVWLSGESSHRSLFQNSVLSASILATAFFLFISLGLYYGLKLKDNVGKILNHERIKKISDKVPLIDGFEFEPLDIAEGIGGIILSIVFWFLFSVIITFLLYILGVFFWAAILLLAAILYWIFFRALRLVFKNSGKCKGNLLKSLTFGLFYSFLYISWIYGIIFLANYLTHNS